MKRKGKAPYIKGNRRTKAQSNLTKWIKEDWQTSDGKKTAKTKYGHRKRYLPKAKWQNMSAQKVKSTNAKKLRGSRKGKQYVKV